YSAIPLCKDTHQGISSSLELTDKFDCLPFIYVHDGYGTPLSREMHPTARYHQMARPKAIPPCSWCGLVSESCHSCLTSPAIRRCREFNPTTTSTCTCAIKQRVVGVSMTAVSGHWLPQSRHFSGANFGHILK